MIPPGFEYGYAVNEHELWCILRDGEGHMLCGKPVGFVPAAQPAQPKHVHRACLEAMYGPDGSKKGPSRAVVYATCPMCQGDAPVYDGRVQGHNAWVLSAIGQPVVSDQACLGVNLPPVVVPKRGRR